VGAFVVVVVEVVGEVALEPGEAEVQVAGEGWSPAFFKDGAVQRLDRPVCLRPPGADRGVAGTELLERGAEAGGAVLTAVVG
jgi:hypothetical protein